MELGIWIPILLTIGAVIAASVSWVQYYNDKRSKQEANDMKAQADSLTHENSILLRRTTEISEESKVKIEKVTNQLVEAQNTVDTLRKENVNNALGSDQVYIAIGGLKKEMILLYNSDNVPSYDFSIQINITLIGTVMIG